MDLTLFIDRLSRNAEVIHGLVQVGDEQARWKPAPDRWSILEVVNHLYDEEREDFRQRLDLLLHQPGAEWPGIDPEGWVVQRRYAERDLGESIDRFLAERRKSVEWLRTIEHPDWERSKVHPIVGEIKAGTMMASWLAHDFLHLRQLARLHHAYADEMAGSYSTIYAGRW